VTVGHVVMDPTTKVQADECQVGFVDDALEPKSFYKATPVHAIFDAKTDRDFAVLKLGDLQFGPAAIPATPMKTNEFAAVGDPVTAYGFPGGSPQVMKTAAGKITGFSRGTVLADDAITQGYSGGPLVDGSGHLAAVSERLSVEIDEKTGEQHVVDYESGDVLSLIDWLDTFGLGEHDKYLTHADPQKFDGAPYVARDEDPGCIHVVRTQEEPTLYCLLSGPYRLVFPNEATYFSWYPDFAGVEYVTTKNLADYALIGNVTMRAGSLVKVQTVPTVYVVSDSLGLLRAIPSEDRAAALFGSSWATKVHDVPDVFFTDYRIGEPVQ
jgi:hypothetical protein